MQLSVKSTPIAQVPKKKNLDELDFFKLLKLEHLSPEEKKIQLDRIHRIAFLHFLNVDLPALLIQADLQQLETMTSDIHNIDLNQVESYIRDKVKNYDMLMRDKMNSVKINTLISHYERELHTLEQQQTLTGADYLVHILAVERLLKAINFGDWDVVEVTVEQTRTHTSLSHH